MAAATKNYPVKFVWDHGGSEVFLSIKNPQGDNRTMAVPFHHYGHHEVTLMLPVGRFEYRYLVDGTWRYDEDLPALKIERTKYNNMIKVKAPTLNEVQWNKTPRPENLQRAKAKVKQQKTRKYKKPTDEVTWSGCRTPFEDTSCRDEFMSEQLWTEEHIQASSPEKESPQVKLASEEKVDKVLSASESTIMSDDVTDNNTDNLPDLEEAFSRETGKKTDKHPVFLTELDPTSIGTDPDLMSQGTDIEDTLEDPEDIDLLMEPKPAQSSNPGGNMFEFANLFSSNLCENLVQEAIKVAATKRNEIRPQIQILIEEILEDEDQEFNDSTFKTKRSDSFVRATEELTDMLTSDLMGNIQRTPISKELLVQTICEHKESHGTAITGSVKADQLANHLAKMRKSQKSEMTTIENDNEISQELTQRPEAKDTDKTEAQDGINEGQNAKRDDNSSSNMSVKVTNLDQVEIMKDAEDAVVVNQEQQFSSKVKKPKIIYKHNIIYMDQARVFPENQTISEESYALGQAESENDNLSNDSGLSSKTVDRVKTEESKSHPSSIKQSLFKNGNSDQSNQDRQEVDVANASSENEIDDDLMTTSSAPNGNKQSAQDMEIIQNRPPPPPPPTIIIDEVALDDTNADFSDEEDFIPPTNEVVAKIKFSIKETTTSVQDEFNDNDVQVPLIQEHNTPQNEDKSLDKDKSTDPDVPEIEDPSSQSNDQDSSIDNDKSKVENSASKLDNSDIETKETNLKYEQSDSNSNPDDDQFAPGSILPANKTKDIEGESGLTDDEQVEKAQKTTSKYKQSDLSSENNDQNDTPSGSPVPTKVRETNGETSFAEGEQAHTDDPSNETVTGTKEAANKDTEKTERSLDHPTQSNENIRNDQSQELSSDDWEDLGVELTLDKAPPQRPNNSPQGQFVDERIPVEEPLCQEVFIAPLYGNKPNQEEPFHGLNIPVEEPICDVMEVALCYETGNNSTESLKELIDQYHVSAMTEAELQISNSQSTVVNGDSGGGKDYDADEEVDGQNELQKSASKSKFLEEIKQKKGDKPEAKESSKSTLRRKKKERQERSRGARPTLATKPKRSRSAGDRSSQAFNGKSGTPLPNIENVSIPSHRKVNPYEDMPKKLDEVFGKIRAEKVEAVAPVSQPEERVAVYFETGDYSVSGMNEAVKLKPTDLKTKKTSHKSRPKIEQNGKHTKPKDQDNPPEPPVADLIQIEEPLVEPPLVMEPQQSDPHTPIPEIPNEEPSEVVEQPLDTNVLETDDAPTLADDVNNVDESSSAQTEIEMLELPPTEDEKLEESGDLNATLEIPDNLEPPRIGINGFERMGRLILQAAFECGLEIQAINDPFIAANFMVYGLKYEVAHSNKTYHKEEMAVRQSPTGQLMVNGKSIHVFECRDSAKIPWEEAGVNYVIETSEALQSAIEAQRHLRSPFRGMKRPKPESITDQPKPHSVVYGGCHHVILASPANDAPLYAVGVNDHKFDPNERIRSHVSPTASALLPILKLLDDSFGLISCSFTLLKSIRVGDSKSIKCPSLGPSSHSKVIKWDFTENLVPIGLNLVSEELVRVIPKLGGKVSGICVYVPTPDVSMLDLTISLKHESDQIYRDVCLKLKEAAEGPLRNVLRYCMKQSDDNPASSVFASDTHSAVVDAKSGTQITRNVVKLVVWFDNDYGFANRIIDLVTKSHILKQRERVSFV
ncbi:hypothetical protein TCAL_13476 [Tigriopus californicus]|uniref:glyceraldehyde-3-phosphate dehydrogenase (phosphorylating) n=1 Tax=Tigriopus californicus TaxID=6832 RepID=A0A553PKD5_TIGCA|nr:hypothetical protein TCAL_13476 [Tigriopus californicus]|eukprot:TCALIF_13476-PA protein Name:"Similar to GAPDH Glyceraldehyde-3-phosphate dehydrogenase (Mustela putorius furo)" AED:0.20 eAED:0.14 QI:0/0.66/0.25/1/0.66/0.75/4/0/1688